MEYIRSDAGENRLHWRALSLPQLYIYEAIRNKNGSGWRMLGRIGSTLLVCHTTNMYICMCVQLKVMQNNNNNNNERTRGARGVQWE